MAMEWLAPIELVFEMSGRSKPKLCAFAEPVKAGR